jgi:inner membrane protein
MEPVTHFLTGAVLARAGLNRKAAYATLAMTLAAEAPDIDTLWGLGGPVVGFEHHRGITHTFLGIPFEAAILVAGFWLFHRWRTSTRPTAKPPAAPPIAPVRWGVLYLLCLIALLSHILLDWTNNYGVRPFFPFNPRWYAGGFVFIFEPVMFLLLLLALVAPLLFGLINSEIGARKQPFRGRGWATFALLAIVGLWYWRWWERTSALHLATAAVPGIRAFASPYPADPFRWAVVVETPDAFHLLATNTLRNTVDESPDRDILYKPPTTLATLAAKRSLLGRVYLDWSMYPLVEQTGIDPDGTATVTFRDLRFLYGTFLSGGDLRRPDPSGPDRPPLTGTVLVDSDRRITEMKMGRRIQH